MQTVRSLLFFLTLACGLFLFIAPIAAEIELQLRDNLKRAQPGDYLVTAQNKNYTILLIRSKDTDYLGIEEITVPSTRVNTKACSWRRWIESGAQGSTSWVLYHIYLPTGTIQQTFSFTRNEWVNIPQSQNFLSTLLNLNLTKIPDSERKRVGPPPSSDSPDKRLTWQPPLISDGQTITGVTFDGWRTRWPKDSSELSGRLIEVYLPTNSDKYPAYFPYWLQVTGIVGKAKVRIVDSGSRITSPARLPPH